jgi:DNA-binding NtrC family response regulator
MNTQIKVLVVDDDKLTRNLLEEELKRTGYSVKTAENGKEAIKIIEEENIDVALLDIKLPDIDGITLLEKIKDSGKLLEVIMITAYGTIESAVEAMKKGAYDYITKPFSLKEVEILIQKSYERKILLKNTISLRHSISRFEHPEEIVYKSPKMAKVLEIVRKVAKEDCPVVIEGETGVGKEVVANYLHRISQRKDNSFVVINCAGLQENLLESEMFGYEKGAFTGADRQKLGLIEIAEGGTLFLDEIADMGISVQSKLLRVIETGEFRRLGSTKFFKANVRIIAATNRNLLKEVKNNRFREDLYYRLNTVTIEIPPLRERKEDIQPLVEYFLKKLTPYKKRISPDAIPILLDYNWPGNVRELKNFLERVIIFSEKDIIDKEDIIPYFKSKTEIQDREEKFLSLKEVELNYIKKVLEYTGGNKTKTAEILNIDRKTLRMKLKELENNSPE